MNIGVSTAVDVGANYGEISLWLTREYPEARIVAIEPSSDNLRVFELNRSAQSFPTDRIELIRQAVTDQAGMVAIQRGVSTTNRVIASDGSNGEERVSCDRLDSLFDRHGIRTADFVKIDIEGGEPKLREALLALRNRVRSYYIEFSQFAPSEDYLALASALLSLDFMCYDETASSRLNNTSEIARHLRTAFEPGPMTVTNLWFISRTA
jgi:FkbM family methyltransferase